MKCSDLEETLRN